MARLSIAPPVASDTLSGVVELATNAEAVTGSDATRAATPANLTARLAAPGAIGGTTPAAGAFTTLTASGDVTLGDAAGDAVVMNAKSITKPNAPAFLAYNSASDTNQTGDGTAATVQFDTEIYDLGGDFASNTFTAPVTGKYHLCGTLLVTSMLAGHTSGYVNVVTSNRSYRVVQANPQACKDAVSDIWCVNFSIDADMDAADTATVTVTISGSTKTNGFYGAAGPFTYFSGHLIG